MAGWRRVVGHFREAFVNSSNYWLSVVEGKCSDNVIISDLLFACMFLNVNKA